MTVHRRALLLGVPSLLLAGCTPSGPGAGVPTSGPTSSAPVGVPTGTGRPTATAGPPGNAAPTGAPAPGAHALPEGMSASARVAAAFAGLDTDTRAGQLLLVAAYAADPGPAVEHVAAHRATGVFLLGTRDDRWNSRDEVQSLVGRLGSVAPAVSALVAADQEGGQVRALRGDDFTRLPSAAEQAATLTPDEVRDLVSRAAAEAAAAGVSMALAPVADVVDPELGDANGPVGALDRGFGTSAEEVGPYVAATVEGWLGAGVLPALKHFPGLGGVTGNTDFTAEGVVDETLVPGSDELGSFAAGIAAGAPAVMMSSARYPGLGSQEPAMFAPEIVTSLLREQMGFGGLVVSDDVGNAAAVQQVSPADRALRFVAAGGDVVLTADASLVREMQTALRDRADADPGFADLLARAVVRVLVAKEAAGLLG